LESTVLTHLRRSIVRLIANSSCRRIVMNTDYVFLCGVMWSQYASEDAGQELVRALESEDPYVVSLASALLEESVAMA
jgi:hypothetical protein